MAQGKAGTWSVMPRAGVSIASLTNSSIIYENADGESLETKPRTLLGFTGGLEVMYQTSDLVGLSAGISYVQGGCKYKDMMMKGDILHDYYVRMDYIAVPLLFHSHVTSGLSVKVGVEPSCLVRGKSHEEHLFFDEDAEGKRSNAHEIEMNENIRSGLRTFALSLPVGISYEYEHVVLDARYHMGLTNTFKGNASRRSNVLEVAVAYKFEL